MQTSEPAFALETAACLWEAVLGLRDDPVTDPDCIARAMQIRASFEAVGTATMRMIVIGWTDAVDMAWAGVADDYAMSFDWDFVPDWIVRNIDWSAPGCPVVRAEPDPAADGSVGHGEEEAESGCDANVAASAELPMPFPSTINTSVSQSLLKRVGRFSNGSVTDILVEAIQNARRAGATHIDIDRIETPGGPVLRIRDDGCGIADPAKFLTLGDSGWDDAIARSEDPAGMGVFSLAGRNVIVRSYAADLGSAWQVSIPAHAWETGMPLDLAPCALATGTELEIDLPESWADSLQSAVKDTARFCPVPIYFAGTRVPQQDFLREAVRVEDWNGCRIGIFADKYHIPRELVRINFHGLAIPCLLPHIVDADGGRGWYAKVDIIDAPQIQLVLPARKEAVQGAALDALREACEAAIFRTIAREGHHRLSFAQWLRAKALGINLPEAAPWLSTWGPRSAEEQNVLLGERVAGEPMILMPAEHPHIEQCVARAIAADQPFGATPVHPLDEFAGYPWYDAIPRVLGCSFRIERQDAEGFDYASDATVPAGLASGRVAAITLECAVTSSCDCADPVDVVALPADVVIVPGDSWMDLEEVAILLSPDCAIAPCDLASLVERACFCPSDDCEADSYHTQQSAFEIQARFTANLLLLGEDAAIIERIREAMREHVSWLVPDDRPITLRVGGRRIDAAFANDVDAPLVDAAA